MTLVDDVFASPAQGEAHPLEADVVFSNASGTVIIRGGDTNGSGGVGRSGGEDSFSGTMVVAPDAEQTSDYLAALRAVACEDGGCASSKSPSVACSSVWNTPWPASTPLYSSQSCRGAGQHSIPFAACNQILPCCCRYAAAVRQAAEAAPKQEQPPEAALPESTGAATAQQSSPGPASAGLSPLSAPAASTPDSLNPG